MGRCVAFPEPTVGQAAKGRNRTERAGGFKHLELHLTPGQGHPGPANWGTAEARHSNERDMAWSNVSEALMRTLSASDEGSAMALVDSRPAPLPPQETKQPRRRSRIVVALIGLGLLAIVAICFLVAGTFRTGAGNQSAGRTANDIPSFASGGLPPCRSNSLHAGVTSLSNSPSQVNATLLTVTNESSSACELFTFPVLQLIDGADKVMATAPPPGQADVKVRIPSGSSAIANLYWQNWCGTALVPLTLHVVLPNQGGTLSSPFGGPTSALLPSCTDPSHASSLVATGGLDSGSLFGTGR